MGNSTNFRVRAAVMAGLAAVVLPLTVAAGCEGGDDSPGVEQNDDGDDDEDD